MKTKISISVFLTFLLISSCTITKREHFSGYLVKMNHFKPQQKMQASDSTNIPENIATVESKSTSKSIYFKEDTPSDNAVTQSVCTTPSIQEVKNNQLVPKKITLLLTKPTLQLEKITQNNEKVFQANKKKTNHIKNPKDHKNRSKLMALISAICAISSLALWVTGLLCIIYNLFTALSAPFPFLIVTLLLVLTSFIFLIFSKRQDKKATDEDHRVAKKLRITAIIFNSLTILAISIPILFLIFLFIL